MKKYKFIIIAVILGLVISAIMVYLLKKKKSYKNMTFDDRTERNLRTLNVEVANKFRNILGKGKEAGYDIRLISANRGCDEQNELYAQGRTKAGKIVTNSKCGESYHQYGVAGDIGFFKDGRYIQDAPWDIFGKWCKEEGGTWGGDFKSLYDPPHCHFSKGMNISELYAEYQRTGKLQVV